MTDYAANTTNAPTAACITPTAPMTHQHGQLEITLRDASANNPLTLSPDNTTTATPSRKAVLPQPFLIDIEYVNCSYFANHIVPTQR
ncbi:hypothetical protein B9J09_03080 [Xylella fastidiosa subsp. pauca]|uniref:hypothetical protein n=1 Tax=Xylella fastidiosa TaxID=2371 RepID=UPI0005833BBA|nr:hypothetical protein [Xylella fastidiosa]ARO68169.1 hypothetical protein B9J09_03080 [Xylella fastidiosa subsp. pauca]AVI22329.1 hypothetical protein BC375_02895 [Xylella fastidiosa]KIA57600.1 hypothetical protein RA12_10475 [Xylella fastidiosa]KXB16757.1 hypothetical protein ADT33_02890 [Xylella fastidiosa]TNW25013.1 hypothetical protein EIP74_00170 [Xylella fastidiosa subsp. pauca]